MDEFRRKFNQFMVGRYGRDSLNSFLLSAAMVLWVISWFIRIGMIARLFHVIIMGLLVIALLRGLSRNINARYRERVLFEEYTAWPRQKLGQLKWRFIKFRQEAPVRKTHRIFRCPQCKQRIRVPKGKGRIEIRCKTCNATFVKRT